MGGLSKRHCLLQSKRDKNVLERFQANPWVPYEGPRHGKGWRNTSTNEVVYQDEKPGPTTGTESTPGYNRNAEADSSDAPRQDATTNNWASSVDYGDMSREDQVAVNRALADVMTHSGLNKLAEIIPSRRPERAAIHLQPNGVVLELGHALGRVNKPEYLKKRVADFKAMMRSPTFAADEQSVEYFRALSAAAENQAHAYLSGRRDYYVEHSLFAFDNAVEASVRHELGHAWHWQNASEVAAAFGNEAITRARPPKELCPTLRSRDNWMECFAENFTLYSIGKTEHLHPSMANFLESHTSWSWR